MDLSMFAPGDLWQASQSGHHLISLGVGGEDPAAARGCVNREGGNASYIGDGGSHSSRPWESCMVIIAALWLALISCDFNFQGSDTFDGPGRDVNMLCGVMIGPLVSCERLDLAPWSVIVLEERGKWINLRMFASYESRIPSGNNLALTIWRSDNWNRYPSRWPDAASNCLGVVVLIYENIWDRESVVVYSVSTLSMNKVKDQSWPARMFSSLAVQLSR